MKTARVLFWVGILVAAVGLVSDGAMFARALSANAVGLNTGAYVVSLISPIWQGGLLIGLAKVIEYMAQAESRR